MVNLRMIELTRSLNKMGMIYYKISAMTLSVMCINIALYATVSEWKPATTGNKHLNSHDIFPFSLSPMIFFYKITAFHDFSVTFHDIFIFLVFPWPWEKLFLNICFTC